MRIGMRSTQQPNPFQQLSPNIQVAAQAAKKEHQNIFKTNKPPSSSPLNLEVNQFLGGISFLV